MKANTLRAYAKNDIIKYKKPKRTQDLIPIKNIYDNGIFELLNGNFTKTYRFDDVDYQNVSEQEQENIFKRYCEIINSTEAGENIKFTISCRRKTNEEFARERNYQLKGDKLDEYREELNKVLLNKHNETNGIKKDHYITFSYDQDLMTSSNYFDRTYADLQVIFDNLRSELRPLSTEERLHFLHDFYRYGEMRNNDITVESLKAKGCDFRDYIAPTIFENESSYYKIGDKFVQAMQMTDFPNYLSDKFISELSNVNRDLIISIDVKVVPTEVAVRAANLKADSIEANIQKRRKKQVENNNFSGEISIHDQQARAYLQELITDLTERDMKLTFGSVTLVHMADSLKELNDTKAAIQRIGEKCVCRLDVLKTQQLAGIDTVLPYGVKCVQASRTLTTESVGAFMPFNSRRIDHKNGVYFGQNDNNSSMLFVDRAELINGNGIVLALPGGGKSFIAKSEVIQRYLMDDNVDIILIDPQGEYGFVTNFGGEVVKISKSSSHRINPFDLNKDYDPDGANPIALKNDFIAAMVEMMMTGEKITARTKSVIDRCSEKIYETFKVSNFTGTPPTLKDFYEELLKQPEPIAKEIALAIEMYIKGSTQTFSEHTNVNIDNRLISYDIKDLGVGLKSIGILVILENVLNKISANKRLGRKTYIVFDEMHLLTATEFAASRLNSLWKTVRKFGAYCIGITQNVDDLLKSEIARSIVSNSELVVMLKQSESDAYLLQNILHFSDEQKRRLLTVPVGSGLLKVGNSFINFTNNFPKNTKLYKHFSTNPNEVL